MRSATRIKPLFFLVLFCSLYVHRSHAQESQVSNTGTRNHPVLNPSGIRAMDSLHVFKDDHRQLPFIFQKKDELQNGSSQPLPRMEIKPGSRVLPRSQMLQANMMKMSGEVCYVISGRDFLKQDSLALWPGDPTLTADGNVIVTGQFGDYSTNIRTWGGFCMKTDLQGNVTWAKLYDSAVHNGYHFYNYFKSMEMRDGSIVMAGRTENNISGNNDFILTKLDKDGNIIWTKTYESRFWQGFNGSGDLFGLKSLQEDPATGAIYFTGYHWTGRSTVTKVDPVDGKIIWSNAYQTWATDRAFGLVINAANLLLFTLEFDSYNESYIHATALDKINGDTLFSKHLVKTGYRYAAGLYGTYEVIKQHNGHYLMSGPTTLYSEFPKYTGTVDLYHAGVIELDENLDFVKAYGFKNRVESNSYNTKVSLFPDGSGVFTMFDIISGFRGEAQISLFRGDAIYHQRKRIHENEGLPYEPPTLQMADGGFLNIKLMGDSTKLLKDGSRIDYYRIHTSDTASLCLGLPDSSTSIWRFNYVPVSRRIDSIQRNVFRESRPKKHDTWNFSAYRRPACEVISHCDTLAMKASAPGICMGTTVVITTHKNKACGSLVPLSYDTNWVKKVTRLSDTTYAFEFNKPGRGYIRGSLMGCMLREDSVLIEVFETRYSLDLGRDTVICPGNRIMLNAGKGFAAYKWQDGSSDSTFVITASGKYYITTVNSCGNIYSDTIVVNDHPAVPVSIGPDRIKCNNDTLKLAGPAGFISYTWSSNHDFSSGIGKDITVNPKIATRYILAAEKTPGCFGFDTLNVIVNTSPQIYLGADTSICIDQRLPLDGGAGFQQYIWSTGDTQRQLTVNKAGIYSIKAVTDAGCISYDTLRLLKLHELPRPDLGPDSVICMGQTRILRTTGTYVGYTWNTGAVTNSLQVSSPGKYFVTVTDANGCRAADTTFVPSVEMPPSRFLGHDTMICAYGSVLLQANQQFQRQVWSTGYTGATIKVTTPGTYWLQGVSTNSCSGRDSIVIGLKDCLEGLFVPTGFTPNNDRVNDVFMPMIFGDVKSFSFRVYNRWGQVVFETSEPGKGWDGNNKGKPQDTNLFVWSCTYQLNGKEVVQKKGTVVVIK
jgi:gliding motility-associated-like protein